MLPFPVLCRTAMLILLKPSYPDIPPSPSSSPLLCPKSCFFPPLMSLYSLGHLPFPSVSIYGGPCASFSHWTCVVVILTWMWGYTPLPAPALMPQYFGGCLSLFLSNTVAANTGPVRMLRVVPQSSFCSSCSDIASEGACVFLNHRWSVHHSWTFKGKEAGFTGRVVLRPSGCPGYDCPCLD